MDVRDEQERRGVGEVILGVADRRPDWLALSSPSVRWTYGELAARVRGGAGVLVDRVGDTPRPVAVLGAHDGPLVATLLSVLAAGHILVVLDPLAPTAQLDHILAECRPALLLHDEGYRDTAAALRRDALFDLPTVCFDELDGSLRELPVRGLQDPAMLAFTSGTSGAAKGAIITNGVLHNVIDGATSRLGITRDDCMPMLFPTSLAVAAYPMFLPLVNGGTLATLDVRSVGLEPIGPFLQAERITLAYMAPTVIRFLADSVKGLSFPDLRMIALGGEVVDAEVVQLTSELFAPRQIAIGYGTTETGVIALNVLDDPLPTSGPISVGTAVEGIEISIVGDDGRPVPVGSAGEITVASRTLFHGYWDHPELNRQVLTDDEAGRPGWRQYRTGDHGRIDERGELVVSGRIGASVKVRGRMVVLDDVEAMLRSMTEVADAAVVARQRGGHTELVAYVTLSAGQTCPGTEIRQRLLRDHEPFEVPSTIVLLDELPTLPNGKVDRRSLPSPESVLGSTRAVPQSVGTGHQLDRRRAQLCEIWEKLLPVGTVGADEDFFALGGDSLLAAQMLILVEQELGVIVPMGELLHARTVRELAAVVDRLSDAVHGDGDSTVTCVQSGVEGRPRLWFFPDLHGSAYRARHLAAALGSDQPVWSFESPLLSGEANPYTLLGPFLVRLVDDLQRAQPDGPVWLAGYSFGGICAYEAARQLHAAGREVAFVGVVDVGPGYRGPGWHTRHSPLRPWFGIPQPAPAGAGIRERIGYYSRMVRTNPLGAVRHLTVRTGLSGPVDRLRFRSDLRRAGRVRSEWRLWYAWEEHWRLSARGWDRTATFPGTVDLFWAEDSASSDSSMGWGPLVGRLEIHRFPGSHEQILEADGAPALAATLQKVLQARRDEHTATGSA